MKQQEDEVWIGGTRLSSGQATICFFIMVVLIAGFFVANC